jgi:tRNA(fMet)-specific endonuclease VapC
MELILDTNAVSAVAEGEAGAVAALASAESVGIPVIVLGEYRFGIALSRHKVEYERWLEEMVAVCAVHVVDEETALYYASLCVELKRSGTPIPSNDAWIGALCRQHSAALLSRDRHFDHIKGLQRFPW